MTLCRIARLSVRCLPIGRACDPHSTASLPLLVRMLVRGVLQRARLYLPAQRAYSPFNSTVLQASLSCWYRVSVYLSCLNRR